MEQSIEHFSFQDINSISSITKSNVVEQPMMIVSDDDVAVVVEEPLMKDVVSDDVAVVVEEPLMKDVVSDDVAVVVEPDTIVENPSKFLIVINYDKSNTTFPVKDMEADIFTIENNKFTTNVKTKWENILWFLSNYTIWKKYEYLWFPNDDINITEGEIITYLRIVDENKMKISQPSVYKSPKNKNHVHKVLLHNPKQTFRKTHFVENKLVCFERTFVEKELLPFLKENEGYLKTGWGLDIWWSNNNKNKMYIVDQIKIEMNKEDNAKTEGFAEMKHYVSKYKLRLKI